jgi:hypothetical protein
MRLFLISSTLLVFIFAGCTQAAKKQDTHTHEDGSVHSNHSEQAIPAQESFVLTSDTLTAKPDSLSNHVHDHEKTHKHNGKEHKH